MTPGPKIEQLVRHADLGIVLLSGEDGNVKATPLREGSLLRYNNPKKPNKVYPVHRIIWHQQRLRILMETADGKTLRSLSGVLKQPERWTVIGNYHISPELYI